MAEKTTMKTEEKLDDPLFVFELDVARRADELSRLSQFRAMNAVDLWCAAEREVLAAGTDGAKRILARDRATSVR